MLSIRLRRQGKKHQPNYRIVVAEASFPAQGKYREKLGFFNPLTKELVVDKDKVKKWLSKGAQPTNTVAKLLTKLDLQHRLIKVHRFPPKAAKKKEQGVKTEIKTEIKAENKIKEQIKKDNLGAEVEKPQDKPKDI